MWFNYFTLKGGGYIEYTPLTIMTGTVLDYNKHQKTAFGAYIEVYEEPRPSNGDSTFMITDIEISCTWNFRVLYKWINLNAGQKITKIMNPAAHDSKNN